MNTTAEAQKTQTESLSLAYVEDAHNVGCLVRFVGEMTAHQARYSADIQEHGVIIRACHMVVVDRSREPLEVIWRIGTRATIVALDGGHSTLDFGYRTLRMPHRDARPATEQAIPLAVGDTVLLRGTPLEQASIVDRIVGSEVAHPERLQAYLDQAIEKRRKEQ